VCFRWPKPLKCGEAMITGIELFNILASVSKERKTIGLTLDKGEPLDLTLWNAYADKINEYFKPVSTAELQPEDSFWQHPRKII
jgi:hypothetical protein